MAVPQLTITILSTHNNYGRTIVGDSNGKLYTLGQAVLNELVDQKLFKPPISIGKIKERGVMHYELEVKFQTISFQLITFWSQPLLGVQTICAFERDSKRWYLWTPCILSPVVS